MYWKFIPKNTRPSWL